MKLGRKSRVLYQNRHNIVSMSRARTRGVGVRSLAAWFTRRTNYIIASRTFDSTSSASS